MTAPGKRKGQPRKYPTIEEAQEANRQKTRERKRLRGNAPPRPQFIFLLESPDVVPKERLADMRKQAEAREKAEPPLLSSQSRSQRDLPMNRIYRV